MTLDSAEGRILIDAMLEDDPKENLSHHLYSTLALPTDSKDLAQPIWSKPAMDGKMETDPVLTVTADGADGGAARRSVSSRLRPGSSVSPSLVGSRVSSNPTSSPASGVSSPSGGMYDVQNYSQQLHHQLRQQQQEQQQRHQQRQQQDVSPAQSSGEAGAGTSNPESESHSRGVTPPDSGRSTPSVAYSLQSHPRNQVLETHKLSLNTHLPTGKRMLNQYIIEGELGRGVHGKVRLARDTETNEQVAVKIVERESRKRLGQGLGMLGRGGRDKDRSRRETSRAKEVDSYIRSSELEPALVLSPSAALKGKGKPDPSLAGDARSGDSHYFGDDQDRSHEADPASARFAAALVGGGMASSTSSSPSAHFAPLPVSPRSPAAGMRQGRWGDRGPSRPTYADKELERQKEKEREKARKSLLWTTDQKVRREIAIMKKCSHQNVVQLKEVIDDPQSKKIFMVLEYMEGGEIVWKDEAGRPTLTIDECRTTLRDVVCGLEYLHYQGIIHRDIKPANLLLDRERRVKISDFGVSHFSYAMMLANEQAELVGRRGDLANPSLSDDHELAKTAGSPAFFAPELCTAGDSVAVGTPADRSGGSNSPAQPGKSQRPPITKAIDVWALGVTLYCLLFGHTPFTAESEFALFAVIPTTDYAVPTFAGADRLRIGPRKPRWKSTCQWMDEEGDAQPETPTDLVPDVKLSDLSEDACQLLDLLDRLLEKDPTKRIKLEEVKKHPWVTRGLEDAPAWLSETDPHQHPFVEITHADVEGALTGFSKFKQKVKRWQSKIFESLGGGHRKRSHTMAHAISADEFRDTTDSPSGSPALDHGPQHDHATNRSPKHGGSAPSSTSRAPRTPLLGRPHYFFSRRQSAQSIGKQGTSQMVAPLTSTGAGGGDQQHANGNQSAVPSVQSSPLRTAARPQCPNPPSSRPGSPQDGLLSARGLAAPSIRPTNQLAPPTVQRRSSSRSASSVALPSVSVGGAAGLDGSRKSSDSHARHSAAQASLYAVVQQQAEQPGASEGPCSGSVRLRSPEVDSASQCESMAATSSQDGHAPAKHRMSIESLGRSSMASVSQTSRASHRNRLGDFLRGNWLQYGDAGRRSSSRPGTMSSKGANSPQLSTTVAGHHHALVAEAHKPLGDARQAPVELRIDAIGAANQLGPRLDLGTPISAPLLSVSTRRSSVGGTSFSPEMSSDDHGRFAPLGSMAVSQPSSPPRSHGMTFGTSTSSFGHTGSQLGRVLSSDRANMVDLGQDDVDLDLELSDDEDFDEDDEARPAGIAIASNDGSGWVFRQDAQYLPEVMQQPQSEVSSQDILTPSVEGGYNVTKPPYRHLQPRPDENEIGGGEAAESLHQGLAMLAMSSDGTSLPTFDLQPDLSAEAEALRRADAAAAAAADTAAAETASPTLNDSLSPSRSCSQKSNSNGASRSPSRMGSVPEGHAVTASEESRPSSEPSAGAASSAADSGVVLATAADDQFADADEAKVGPALLDGATDGGIDVDDDDCDSDEMAVSFQARKKSSRMLHQRSSRLA